ncbi:hypothetical protein D922_01913 [Enterococcus faecalis 06-MB-DW-09]|nr:hypothetical protein D922_01913 [Enterococcus faecalis 06-MB-DW-09]
MSPGCFFYLRSVNSGVAIESESNKYSEKSQNLGNRSQRNGECYVNI